MTKHPTATPAQSRQEAVARLIYAEGRTQQQAAAQLGVSQRTVSYYKARIDAAVAASLRRSAIADAVVALGRACEPDGMYDPADDPRVEDAGAALAALVGDDVAAAVASGLQSLWTRWVMDQKGLGE